MPVKTVKTSRKRTFKTVKTFKNVFIFDEYRTYAENLSNPHFSVNSAPLLPCALNCKLGA
jgi:hypothetical protein